MNEFHLPESTPLANGYKLELVNLSHVRGIYHHSVKYRDSLSEWLPWARDINVMSDTQRFIEKVAIDQAQDKIAWHFAITHHEEAVGMVSYHPIEWIHRKTNLGYWISPEHQGKGLVTAASQKLIEWAFEKLFLNRVGLQCGVDNFKSRKVAQKLGMTLEGTERDAEWLYDHFIDHHTYSLLKKEYLKSKELNIHQG